MDFSSAFSTIQTHVLIKNVLILEVSADLILWISRLALKSGIDGHLESPQVGHSRPANTSQRLNSVYVVASSD